MEEPFATSKVRCTPAGSTKGEGYDYVSRREEEEEEGGGGERGGGTRDRKPNQDHTGRSGSRTTRMAIERDALVGLMMKCRAEMERERVRERKVEEGGGERRGEQESERDTIAIMVDTDFLQWSRFSPFAPARGFDEAMVIRAVSDRSNPSIFFFFFSLSNSLSLSLSLTLSLSTHVHVHAHAHMN